MSLSAAFSRRKGSGVCNVQIDANVAANCVKSVQLIYWDRVIRASAPAGVSLVAGEGCLQVAGEQEEGCRCAVMPVQVQACSCRRRDCTSQCR